MSFANTTYTDIVATTLEKRSKKLADNITGNNALLKVLEMRGNIRPFSGGRTLIEEILQKENGNAGWYSGYDELPTGAADVISAAEFAIKQAACPVVMSGLEEIQNDGEEAVIDLLDGRIKAAEATMANLISAGLYSDGTGSGSKQITGVLATAPVVTTSGIYGGINRATAGNEFWQSYAGDSGAAPSASTIMGFFNTAWANLTRGTDHPDLIPVDNTTWSAYVAALQTNQRFTDSKLAQAGFSTVKHMAGDVVLDGGVGGDATSVTAYFLNTKYLHWRPHSKRNMVPLKARSPWNQDASVTTLVFAGNLTCSGARFQGQVVFS
jgi:hypothetical protein